MKRLKLLLIIFLLLIYIYFNYYSYEIKAKYGILEAHIENIKIVILLLGITLLYFYLKNIIKEKKYKSGVKFYFASLLRLLYYITVLSALFVYLGGSLEGLSTIIGLIGAGLAISLQKPILNFAGFLSLLVHRIYSKGDVVEIDNIRGIVYDISTMHTKILEYDENGIEKDIVVTIPNSLVLDKKVKNYSKPVDKTSFSFTMSLTYSSDIDKAIEKTKKIITSEWKLFNKKNKDLIEKLGYSKIMEKPNFRISTMFNDSSIDLTITFKAPLILSAKMRTALVISLFKKLPEKDIEFAYPHLEVLFRKKGK